MEKFIEKWHLKSIKDDGAVVSYEFNRMAHDLKEAMIREAKKYGFEVVDFSKGHYYISGFLRKNANYVFFSWNCPRWDEEIDVTKSDCVDGILFRTARNQMDYKGGMNHFTSLAEFGDSVSLLLKRGAA